MTHRQRQQRRRRRSGPSKRNKVLLALLLVVAVIVVGALGVVGYIAAVAASAPNISQLKPINKGQVSAIYASDGTRLGYVQSDIVRTPIGWKDTPVNLRRATIAIEDKRFYEHGGVDYQGIVRAAIKDIGNGQTLQGGSTITQQLVRALYIPDPRRDLARKIREAKMASELESQHSKEWILTQYLNDVPYGTVGGRTAIGAEAAAQMYFSKSAKDLSLDECALLAGMVQAPSVYNPFQNHGLALQRRNDVLTAMAQSHYISPAAAAEAEAKPIHLHPGTLYTARREPYFFDYVQEQLVERYGAAVIKRGGLKVYTTVEPRMQDEARQAIRQNLYLSSDPSSAIVSIDPNTGYIRAMASSSSYRDTTFNFAAQGHRQPGSAFKVFVLTTAIRQGMNPDTTFYDSKPLSLHLPGGGTWNVRTYENSYSGTINVTEATLKSDNTVYAQLDLDVGPKQVAHTAQMMGITTHLDGIPAEGLGGLRLGVSPLEMADAYATLASGGIHSDPEAITRVAFPDGQVDDVGKPHRERVLSDGIAAAVTKVLQMNIQRGTASHANYGCPAAAKTGTTSNWTDAWLVGYTPTLATAVWVGYPNSLVSMNDVHGIQVQGGSIPADIWHDYMSQSDANCKNFPAPTTPASFSGFFGSHQANKSSGGGGGSVPEPSPRGGGGNYGGYNPSLYAAPPQAPPSVPPPLPNLPNAGGGGVGAPHGNGGRH